MWLALGKDRFESSLLNYQVWSVNSFSGGWLESGHCILPFRNRRKCLPRKFRHIASLREDPNGETGGTGLDVFHGRDASSKHVDLHAHEACWVLFQTISRRQTALPSSDSAWGMKRL